MLVERHTWRVEYGQRSEWVEVVKAWVEAAGLTPRVCSYLYGPKDIVTSDLEFETIQDIQKFWDNFDSKSPAHVSLHEKQHDLGVSYVNKELLNLN